ncbi:MAG TPA: AAA family ATPase [Agriterribacter sp.]|nr:AAA family ATPase [Agriterribacter sp.]HRQ51027.1 AAA family ATPase [Agriterribacter sp.]
MPPLKKIVVIGPESTGKSTLCGQLADHYKTLWCREYAREYLLEHGMDYTYDNLLEIAKGQVALEDKTTADLAEKYRRSSGKHMPLLFIDTDMYVMKVWCEFVFDQCHQWIIDQIVTRRYDLYLLCNTDLPWIKDELREYPDAGTREKLYHMYKDIMINQRTPWVGISGNYDQRFEKAKEAVEYYLKSDI